MCLCRDEWDLCKNHQSLALISLGYGALVLNDFFLKAMKEVVTSSTGAGAFVRNLKGFALYSDKDKSYEIEIFFRGRPLRDIEFFFMVWTLRDIEKFFWGRTLRDIKSDNLILNPSSSGSYTLTVTSTEIMSHMMYVYTVLAPIRKALVV